MISNTLKKTKKSTEINNKSEKSEKIVKRSWKKITIIVSLIVILLIGIGVGFYFIFRPDKFTLNSKILNDGKISIKDAKQKILHNEDDKDIGLFFYKKNGSETNYMTYGDTAGPKGDYSDVDGGVGPFSYWIENNGTEDITWYSIDMDSTDNLEEDLFLVDNNNGGYELNTNMIDGDWSDGFYSENNISEGSSKWSEATKLQLDVREGKKEDKKEDYKGWKVVTRGSDPEPGPEQTFKDTNISEEEFNISEGSTMIFNSAGKIKGLANGYDSSTAISKDNEEEYRTWYKAFFDDFIDLNNYDE